MNELKPCPFCGGDAELRHTDITSEYGRTSYVTCTKCLIKGTMINISFKYSSDERAIEAWNRRATKDD